jgi:Tol biopolymer transport system component
MLAPLLAAAALVLPVWDSAGTPSPNGQWVLFTRTYPHNRYSTSTAVFVVGTDGSRLRRLAGPYPPATGGGWSPDNLVLLGPRLVDPASGNVVRRTALPGPDWSPDGRLAAYSDKGTLYVANADGSDPRVVATSPRGYFGGTYWAPDSRRLAYTVPAGAFDYALELVDADGADRTRVMTAVAGFPVSWAPDGTRLAFGAQLGARRYRPPHVYLVNRDGTSRRLFDGADSWAPDWSPRGDWIAYDRTLHTRTADIEQVVLVHPDGTARHVLKGVAGHHWLPGGRRLVVAAQGRCRRTGVYTIALDGTHRTRLTNRCQ